MTDMFDIFHACSPARFAAWWDKAHPNKALQWPVAAATIKTLPNGKFDFQNEGKPAVILPVGIRDLNMEPMSKTDIFSLRHIADFIAWLPADPATWYFFQGVQGLSLGHEAVTSAHLYKQALLVPDTPLAWLEQGGSFPLDDEAIENYRDLTIVECSAKMGERLTNRLTRMPRLIKKD